VQEGRIWGARWGTASDEGKLSGADVQEVIAWSEANCGDHTHTLYACVPRRGSAWSVWPVKTPTR
jgi:hypothetical protein